MFLDYIHGYNKMESDSEGNVPALDVLPKNVLLKTKLDSIFAEVERSLPSVEFDSSDVSRITCTS